MVAFAAAFATGCGEDAPAEIGADEPNEAPLYAIAATLPSFSQSSMFVSITDSLDVAEFDISNAREFEGAAQVSASSGKLFVSDGESPRITRYAISDEGSWRAEETISFAGLVSVGALTTVFVDPRTAYSPLGVLGRILWDPEEMVILETREPPEDVPFLRDGLTANLGYDQPVRENRLYHMVYWADASFVSYSETSQVIVYDTESSDVVNVLSAPCPHLHIASRDANGDLYLSNGSGSGTMRLFDGSAPRNCVVRVRIGQDRLDENFTFDFAEVTGGREGAAFRVLDETTAMFAVFHDEDIEITNDSNPLLVNISANWRLWSMNLETRAAGPIEGFEPFSGQYVVFRVDGRTLISMPEANYQSTTVFELLPDGSAEKRFVADGFVFEIIRLR
ncbi:MAG: hypothetical protein AAGF92_14400 [Myxococcota bacterium]